jgi:hypothetical protein
MCGNGSVTTWPRLTLASALGIMQIHPLILITLTSTPS